MSERASKSLELE